MQFTIISVLLLSASVLAIPVPQGANNNAPTNFDQWKDYNKNAIGAVGDNIGNSFSYVGQAGKDVVKGAKSGVITLKNGVEGQVGNTYRKGLDTVGDKFIEVGSKVKGDGPQPN